MHVCTRVGLRFFPSEIPVILRRADAGFDFLKIAGNTDFVDADGSLIGGERWGINNMCN